jgi:hypothetical protein
MKSFLLWLNLRLLRGLDVLRYKDQRLPLVFGSTTFATTPEPNNSNKKVPINSAIKYFIMIPASFCFVQLLYAKNVGIALAVLCPYWAYMFALPATVLLKPP